MITVISGTNREGNVSVRVAQTVIRLLTIGEQESQLLDLRKLPHDFLFRNDVYGNADPGFSAVSSQFVSDADKFVFVVPEYNGSVPGVLKGFIDAVWPEQFKGKKAALIGIASGRSGNVRGLDHLTNILNYLQVAVHPVKININHIDKHLDEDGMLNDDRIMMTLERQMNKLVEF